jgi:hypothetical protein
VNDHKSANRVGIAVFSSGQLSLKRRQQRLGGEHVRSSDIAGSGKFRLLGHADGLWTCLLIEVDQKWPADAQNGAHDPMQASLQSSELMLVVRAAARQGNREILKP